MKNFDRRLAKLEDRLAVRLCPRSAAAAPSRRVQAGADAELGELQMPADRRLIGQVLGNPSLVSLA
jgi:hypothetical protein